MLQDINIGENWLTDSAVALKLNYLGHVKHHSSLVRTVKKSRD